MAIDPQYNVALTADELNSQIPMSIQYGVTPDDKFMPIRIDAQGRLVISGGGGGGTVPTDTEDGSVMAGQESALSIGMNYGYNGSDWERITSTSGALNVNIVSSVSGATPINQFGSIAVPVSTETTIVSYTVPLAQELEITGLVGWGDWDGEFILRVDGVQKGGGRTSSATRTLALSYDSAPIIATAGQVVTIRAITDTATATKAMKANLMGRLQ